MELKKLINEFNTVVVRLNDAEKYFNGKSKRICTDEDFEKFEPTYINLVNKASQIANKIESFLGRPVTSYESLHGINI